MLEWLKQRVISWFLSRYVGRWIHVDKEKLHGETQGSVWSLEVNDLLLKKDCLNDYDIPFSLRSGTVQHMHILWKDKHSVHIKVDTIFMVLQSRQLEHLETTPEQKKELERQIKQALLEQWDSQLDGVLAPAPMDEDASKQKVPSDAYRAILDKLEVTISNIHLCFYESKSNKTFGSHIDCITLKNSDSDAPSKYDGHTVKHAEISGLAVYLDSGAVPDTPTEMIGRQHEYLLSPISTKATIGYDVPKARWDLSRPKVCLSCIIDDLVVHLQREQYLSVVGLLDWWSKSTRFNLPRDGRPFCLPGEAQGATQMWWQFVIETILQDIRERRRRRTLAYLVQRRKDRLRYVELYTKQRGADLSSKEKKEFGAFEDQYDYHDVVFFRCTAIKRLQASSQVVKRKSSSWFRWGRRAEAAEESEQDAEAKNPMGSLTEEERNALLAALDVGPVEVGAADSLVSATNADQVLYAVDLRVAMCKFGIQDAEKGVSMSVAVTQSMLDLAGRQNAVTVRAGMHSLNVMDEQDGVPLCRHAGGDGGELLSVVVDSNQGVTPRALALEVRVSTLHCIFNPTALQSFSEFWDIVDPEVDLARARRYATEAYSELRKKNPDGDAALESESEEQGGDVGLSVKLDVDIAAPHIFVYEKTAGSAGTSVLALRLGHFAVKDVASARANDQRSLHHNSYQIAIDKVGVDLLREFSIASLEPSSRERVVLMQDTQMSAEVDVTLPLRPEHEHGVEVKATLEALQARGNMTSICDAVRIAASWSHKPLEDEPMLEQQPASRRGRSLGRVLVKGLGGREAWVWRWVSLQGPVVHLCASGDADAVPEARLPIDSVQVKSDMHKGKAVILLEALSSRGADLILFAGPNHSSLISHMRTKQREVNPLLEYQAPIAPAAEESDAAAAARQELSSRLWFRVCLVQAVLEKEDQPGSSVLDFQLKEMVSVYHNRGETLFSLEMETLRVGSEQAGEGLPDVISPSAAEDGCCLSVALSGEKESGQLPEVRVAMKAMKVRVDPVFTGVVLQLQQRLEQAASPVDEGARRGRSMEDSQEGGQRRGRSSQERSSQERSMASQSGSIVDWGRLDSSVLVLHGFEPPAELIDPSLSTKAKGTVLSFTGTGLTVQFMDGQLRHVWQAEMGTVTVQQSGFADGSTSVKGTMESFRVSDTSFAESCHPQLLTMANESDALVRFELTQHDMLSVHAPDVGGEVKVSINQPQITVLFRMVNQIQEYASIFSQTNDADESGPIAERPSASRADEAPAIRYKIELHHPLVIVPRSSRSQEAYVADLGSIAVQNSVSAGAVGKSEWNIVLKEMKLETVAGTGDRAAMLEHVNGTAKVVMAEFVGAGEGEGEVSVPDFLVEVALEETCGRMTDAQYGLLMCILGENLTEKNARYVDSDASAHAQTDTTVSFAALQSLSDLAAVLQAAVPAARDVPARSVYRLEVPSLDVSLCSALDASSMQYTPLVRAVGKRLKVAYELLDPASMTAAATPSGDGLVWQMTGGLSYLDVVDDRPGMQSPLAFLSTHDKTTEDDRFRLAFNKTRSSHTGIDLDFKGVSLVDDAGLFFSALAWLGRGSEMTKSIKAQEGDLLYTIGYPGGLLVSTRFDSAAIHLVADLLQADVNKFILKGSLDISYNNLFQESSLEVSLRDLHLFSYLHHGNDTEILGPSSGSLTYSWCAGGQTAAELNTTFTGFEARLSHQDVIKVSAVYATLMRSLEVQERPPVDQQETVAAEAQQPLNFHLTVTAISVSLEDRDNLEPVMRIAAQRGTCDGVRQAGGAIAMHGELLSLAVTDTSVKRSLHADILTISETSDTLVKFDFSTFSPTAPDYPGYDQHLHLHINRPQITVLWRFIEELRAYINSFHESNPDISRTLSNPLSPTSPITAREASDKDTSKMKVKIELHHPLVVIPRSSLSQEQYMADLGSIEVHNTLTHVHEGKSEWNVVLQQMKLETVSGSGLRATMLEDVNGKANILMAEFTGPERPDAEPEMLVTIDLEETKGLMTDAQYALLLSILGENMTERRLRSQPDRVPSGRSSASFKADAVSSSLAKILDAASHLSQNIRVTSKYCVRIQRLNVGLRLAESLDVSPEDATTMVRVIGDELAVQFCGLYQDPARTDDRLVWECEAAFGGFEVVDRRPAMAARGLPFVSASADGKEAQVQMDEKPPYSSSLAGRHGFAMRFRKTFCSHMGIDLKFKGCKIVADFGLLMNCLGWLGRGGSETAKIQERCGDLGYTVVSPGGIIVDIRMPFSRIYMVTSFEASKPDGFLVGASLACVYASIGDAMRVGSSFSLDVPDFCLQSMSSARQASNANMLLVRPCEVKFDQQWQTETEPSGATAISTVYAFHSMGLRAMVTYEDTHLIFEVVANIMKNYSPDATPSKQPRRGDQVVGQAEPPTPKQPNSSAKPMLAHQGTTKKLPSGQAEGAAGEVVNSLRVKLNLADIKLTFVDDYKGRWIPMLRWNVDKLAVRDDADTIKGHVRSGLDYFHGRTSTWRKGLEDWDMDVSFSSAGGTRLNLCSEEMFLVHISSDMISSVLRASNTWTQDRREYASVTEATASGSSDQASAAEGPPFVPYVVRNYLAEDLVCVLEDGSEFDVPAQAALELTYEQVWKRSGALHMYARDADESSISNHLFLQLKNESQVFCSICVERESTTTHEVQLGSAAVGNRSSQLLIVCDLAHQDGQKILSVSSMVTVRNRSKVPVMTGVELEGSGDVVQTGLIPPDGMVAVPLIYSLAGTLTFRPLVNDLDYLWCSGITEGINLRSLHEGTLRTSQVVDTKFQRLFGKDLPAETTLIEWYACANDTDGGVMKQGVMYVTDHAICHHSNIIGREQKTIIRIRDIIKMRKVYTALVFPNAIAISTHDKTWYFRTFTNRAEAFRTILQVLPNKSVAAEEDDVDDKARRHFQLAPSDTILSMYSASWHHDPRITGGYVMLTTHHLLFMSSSDPGSGAIKLPWKNIVALEKKKSFIIQNNALLVKTRDGQTAFFSSTKWNRDKVLTEEMTQLWQSANGNSSVHSRESDKDATEVGVRCRTLTCNIIDSMATKVQQDPTDNNQVYQRQKWRAKDTVTWSVVVMDAVTRKVGSDRTAGHPCLIELHPPWVIQNFTSSALEVQLIDSVSSVIATVSLSSGASDQQLAVDLRREIHFRARANPWSPAKWTDTVLVHSGSRNPELETVVEVPDSDGGSQSVVIEVTKDKTTCGFRICLYNRFWLLNLTSLPLKVRRFVGVDYTPTKALANGKPFGCDFAKDAADNLEVTLDGFIWSDPFSVETSAESLTVELLSEDERQTNSARELMVKPVPNDRLQLDVSSCTAREPFDRTTVVTFAPQLIVENCLEEALVVWQRGVTGHHPKWLEQGQACAFFHEGPFDRCRLSANLACLDSDDVRESRAVFSPFWCSNEPVLLECSDQRVILAETVPLLEGNVSTHMLRFREPTGVVPHKVVNLTHYSLGFKQLNSSKSWVTYVRPWQRVKMVWPEPLKPKVLQLVEIDGQRVQDSGAASHGSQAVNVDDLKSEPQPLIPRDSTGVTQRLTAKAEADAQGAADGQGTFVLRMHHQRGAPLLAEGLYPGVIPLDAPQIVVGREGFSADGVKSVVLGSDGDGDVHGIVSRQHLRISQPKEGCWLLEDLGSTNGVLVNGVRKTSHFLQVGDIVTIGAGKGVKAGQAPTNPWSPFTYMFEDATSFAFRRCKEAGLLQGTVRLDKGTKVVYLSIGDLLDESKKIGPSTSFSVSLSTPGLGFLLEDDCQGGDGETEELLYAQFEDVQLNYISGAETSQINASVMSFQIDNQFDPQTSFPVIASVAPADGRAFSITLMEKVGELGVDKYFDSISSELKEPYIFIDDRLILKLATFFGSFSVSSSDRGSDSRQTFVLAAKPEGQGGTDALEVEAGLGEMHVLMDAVVKGKAATELELEGGGSVDPYVYVHLLRTKELRLHLTLMLTEGNDVIRRYAGPLVQRVLRNIRVEDIVIKVPPLEENRQLKKKSAMTLHVTNIFLQSLRKTFFSSKFLFKGLDAWSDKIFNLQSQGQKAGDERLARKRGLPESALAAVEEPAAPSLLSLPKRAVTTVASIPVQGIKTGLKTGAKQLGRLGNLLG